MRTMVLIFMVYMFAAPLKASRWVFNSCAQRSTEAVTTYGRKVETVREGEKNKKGIARDDDDLQCTTASWRVVLSVTGPLYSRLDQ